MNYQISNNGNFIEVLEKVEMPAYLSSVAEAVYRVTLPNVEGWHISYKVVIKPEYKREGGFFEGRISEDAFNNERGMRIHVKQYERWASLRRDLCGQH